MSASSTPFEPEASCTRCINMEEVFPIVLALALALFCTVCVFLHVLLFLKERRETRKRSCNDIKTRKTEAEEDQQPVGSCAACTSLICCLLQAIGFCLLAFAAWQHSKDEDGVNMIVLIGGAACVGSGLLVFGLSACIGLRANTHQSEEADTDEESDTDLEIGATKSADGQKNSKAVMLRIDSTVATSTSVETETVMIKPPSKPLLEPSLDDISEL